MYVWIDNDCEDVRVSTHKKNLQRAVEKDYRMDEDMKWEVRGESTALVEDSEDCYQEFGVIVKAKDVK